VDDMKSGRIRHRVTIQRFVQSEDDGIGGTVGNWKDIATIWAKVTPLSSKDVLISQQLKNNATHEVEIRYRIDINAKMRLLYRGRVLDNISIRDIDELRKEIRLLCREVR
jgi:SPP1 family predicted phage head-tail adaptor